MTKNHHHRSGGLSQSNKKQKTRKSSKRSLNRRYIVGSVTKHGAANSKKNTKAQRLLQSKQRREKSRLDIQRSNRRRKGKMIPSVVGIMGLSNGTNDDVRSKEDFVLNELQQQCQFKIDDSNLLSCDTWKWCGRFYKNSCATVGSSSNEMVNILEMGRACDYLVFVVWDVDEKTDWVSELGNSILNVLNVQNKCPVIVNVNQSSKKNYLKRVMEVELGTQIKVFEVSEGKSNAHEMNALIRCLATTSSKVEKKIGELPRSSLISEGGYTYQDGELKLKGFVRNTALCLKSLVHVINVGTFGIKRIESDSRNWVNIESTGKEVEFATPDALEGEQNLIGFDENDDEDEEVSEEEQSIMKDYASEWMEEIDQDGEESKSRAALSDFFNKKSESSTVDMLDEEDEINDKDEEEREKALRSEQQFPDEVELNREELGRDRYARYRALQSFRKSYWDPLENLPDEYGKMFQFQHFKGTQKDVVRKARLVHNNDYDFDPNAMQDEGEDNSEQYVPVNTFITLVLSVPQHRLQNTLNTTKDIIFSAVSLLLHENKASVLHLSLSPTLQNEKIIKSKDKLTFHLGHRTFESRPIFSLPNLNCDKHKYERFMPTKGFFVASVYGPVSYAPCPVHVFDEDNRMVATGNLQTVDSRRIIVKRIVLTGYPTRVRKRWATVKYMFSNPEDVKWFQPAGLSTKHGLQGNITESVGEHGTMKCLFNKPIQQHDTVILPLYKRIYPKFVPHELEGNNTGTVNDLVIH